MKTSGHRVLSQQTLKVIADFWSADFDCPTESLLARPLHILTHGPSLADYNGVFALFRNGMTTVSFPPAAADELKQLLSNPPFTPTEFSKAFDRLGFRIVGPASLRYSEQAPLPKHEVRSLTKEDQSALQQLRTNCGSIEWEHGGSDFDAAALSGVFTGGELISVAGYEVWGGTLAHISVITCPEHRGHGYAGSAVADIARAALNAGLIPQYRTLESNGPSISVARSLGFIHYASSVAVKLDERKI